MAVQHQWGYLTFEEAARILGIDKNEFMRHVAANHIVPCKFFKGRYKRFSIEDDGPDGKPFFLDYDILYMEGLFYLQGYCQTGPASCEWKWFSESRSCDGGESLYEIRSDLKSNDLMAEVVFRCEEIERFRGKLNAALKDKRTDTSDEHVSERRINNMRKLIIGAMISCYAYKPTALRSDAIAVFHSDLEKLGIEISLQTVRNIVKDAAQVLPQKKDG